MYFEEREINQIFRQIDKNISYMTADEYNCYIGFQLEVLQAVQGGEPLDKQDMDKLRRYLKELD